MTRPVIYPAVKPLIIAQGWGNFAPEVYGQFGFGRHNGRDMGFIEKGIFVRNKRISAPFDYIVYRRGFQPKGAGNYIIIISKEEFDFPDFSCICPDGEVIRFKAGKYKILATYMHNEYIVMNEGQSGLAGDMLSIGDNTGFSTGPHCHEAMQRVTWDGKSIIVADVNDANNTFDPTQFLSPIFAEDVPSNIKKLQEEVTVLTLKLAEILKGRSA